MKLINLMEKKEENPCKGLFFRGRVNRYITSRKGIMEQKELRFLKRKSCKGCEKCGWLFDHFNEVELVADIISNVEHGKLYIPEIHEQRDWESGAWEVEYIDFKEVIG